MQIFADSGMPCLLPLSPLLSFSLSLALSPDQVRLQNQSLTAGSSVGVFAMILVDSMTFQCATGAAQEKGRGRRTES